MVESICEFTSTLSTKPMKKKININTDYEDFSHATKLTTNLFNISLNQEKLKNIFIYGIDIKDLIHEDSIKIHLLRKCHKLKVFNEYLKSYFIWHKTNGLTLFGKLKNDYIDSLLKFSFIIYIPSNHLTEPAIYPTEQLQGNPNQLLLSPDDLILELNFFKHKNISNLDLTDSNDSKMFSQSMISFFNSIINKLLLQANYKKDITTRKILYYKDSDILACRNNRVATDTNIPIYSFAALKAVCNSYENGNVYLKLLPKNILRNDDRYGSSFMFYMDQAGGRTNDALKKFKEVVLNQKGMTTYNNIMMKIEDVEMVNPFTIFFEQKNKGEGEGQGEGSTSLSVGDYLTKRYRLDIKNTEQLMAVRYIDKNKKIAKENAQKLYFPMDYLAVIGNPFGIKIDIKQVIEKPKDKQDRIMRIRNELTQSKKLSTTNKTEGIESIFGDQLTNVKLDGVIFKQPAIIFGDGNRVNPDEKGHFSIENVKPHDNFELKHVHILIIGLSTEQGGHIYSLLNEASIQLGIKITQSPLIQYFNNNDSLSKDTFTKTINAIADNEKKKKEKNDKLQVLFVFMNKRHPDKDFIYKDIKNIINQSELYVPSQFILYNDKNNKTNLLSAYTNILCQIWAKLGQKLYACDLSFAKNILVISYAVCNYGSNQTLTSLCFSLNDSKAQYCFLSEFAARNDNRLSTVLRPMMKNVLSLLWKLCKRKVDNIMIYREGLNEKQITSARNNELPDIIAGLEDALTYIRDYNDPDNKYDKQKKLWKEMPKICLALVNKFNEIKLFVDSDIDYNQNEQREQNNRLNIPVGTLVDHTITHEIYYDFHLNSAFTAQGTNSPTHYIIIYDNTDLSARIITKLAFYLCYLSYNTTRSIKLPAPLYYVMRRNKFIKENLTGVINKKMQSMNVSL